MIQAVNIKHFNFNGHQCLNIYFKSFGINVKLYRKDYVLP